MAGIMLRLLLLSPLALALPLPQLQMPADSATTTVYQPPLAGAPTAAANPAGLPAAAAPGAPVPPEVPPAAAAQVPPAPPGSATPPAAAPPVAAPPAAPVAAPPAAPVAAPPAAPVAPGPQDGLAAQPAAPISPTTLIVGPDPAATPVSVPDPNAAPITLPVPNATPVVTPTSVPDPAAVSPAAPTTMVASDTSVPQASADPAAAPLADTTASVPPPAEASSSAPPPTETSSTDAKSKPTVSSYYAEYASDKLLPEQINYSLLDWVDFAFVVPASDSTLQWSNDNSQDILRRLVSYAHGNNTKVKVSVGGWSGSTAFSDIAKTDGGRNGLASALGDMYKTFGVDGIDMDWEYPGMAGADSHYDASDTANYAELLKAIRAALPSGAILTAAVSNSPFADSTGQPSKDLSQFASLFDWILLMNYDVWGSSSTPGPNAPLAADCSGATQPDNNAAAGVKAWTQAGFKPEQITLGVPSYGYVNPSDASTLQHRRRSLDKRFIVGTAADQFQFQSGSQAGAAQTGGSIPADGDKQVQFRDLVEGGFLQSSGDSSGSNPQFVGAGGFERVWDDCSSTPFLRSSTAHQVVTYDDPDSMVLKAAFVKSNGLLGLNLYDLHGDTANWDLLNALRRGI